MSARILTILAVLAVASSACFDFAAELEACRDGGRCATPSVAIEDGGSTDGGTGSGDFTVSPTASTVVVSPASLPADGASEASVVVTVVNARSQPLLGQLVTLVHSGLGLVEPAQKTTNMEGIARFTVTSPQATSGTLVATVNPGGSQVVLAASPSVTFVAVHSLGGRVTGASETGLILRTSGAPDLQVPAGASTFAFTHRLMVGTPYAVTVASSPSAQRCAVDGGTGIMGDVDVDSIEVSCVSTWVSVAAGATHSVGLKTDGTLWTWGSNGRGELGDGTNEAHGVPHRIAAGFASVAGGGFHSMAITGDGGLWAWGYNNSGQLGAGSPFSNRLSPVFVGDGYRAVALGAVFSLLLKESGKLFAVGYNNTGQAGDGTAETKFFPVSVLKNVASVSAGSLHSLALLTDGGLVSWGYDGYGTIGIGSDSGVPVLVPTLVPGHFVQAVGGGFHTLALTADGAVWGWGMNATGELGDPTDTAPRIAPQRTTTGFTRLATGGSHGLGFRSDGTLWAWGSCDKGQLGDGCDAGMKGPVLVGGDFVSVSAGFAHTLGLKRDGTLWAWGSNESGQLGIGADGGAFPSPTLIR